MDDPATLWDVAMYLIFFSAYVVGSVVGVLLYPKPQGSFQRFLLLVLVGLLFALAALSNPCMRPGFSERKYHLRVRS